MHSTSGHLGTNYIWLTPLQWRIQDFLDTGANPEDKAPTHYLAKFV